MSESPLAKIAPFLGIIFATVAEAAAAIGEPEHVVYARVAEHCRQMAAGEVADVTDPIMLKLIQKFGTPG